MTVSDICDVIKAQGVCGDLSKNFDGVYIGDLLSRAMSHVEYGNLWITIMSNINVVAVAALTEPAAIILAEGVELQEEALAGAKENGITVISSELSAYEIAVKLNTAVSES